MIKIWAPRWHDRKVLVAKYKVRDGNNDIMFIKTPSMKGIVYKLSGDTIRSYPVESNGKIDCYVVPMGEFEEKARLK